MSMSIYCANFDLEQIANSGQCFRWVKISDKVWRFPIKNEWYLAWHSDEDHKQIFISKENDTDVDEETINEYFDIKTDYHSIINRIPENDTYLKTAAEKYYGIRILKQDLWETIVSFIISQNNNIPRIKKSIEKLCDEIPHKRFPTPWDILEMNLSDKGLGYRDKYLEDAAHWYLWRFDNTKMALINSDNPKSDLMEVKGIGNKVADCICLFGLHRIDSCPIDTWMKKIINVRYGGIQPEWMKSEYAGIFQQYVFAYERSLDGNK